MGRTATHAAQRAAGEHKCLYSVTVGVGCLLAAAVSVSPAWVAPGCLLPLH